MLDLYRFERAPDVTDVQFERLSRLTQHTDLHIPLQDVTTEFIDNILCESGVECMSSSRVKVSVPCIKPDCFIALLWFAEKIFRLPITPHLMDRLVQGMRDDAHNSSTSSMQVWQNGMQMYTTVQKDVATFLWHKGVRLPEEPLDEEVLPRAKKQRRTK